LVEALARRDGAALLAEVDALRSGGQSAAGTLEEIAALLQQMAVEQAVPGALDAQDPENEDAMAAAPLLAPDETQLLYSMALHGREELSLASDEYGALTMVLLRFLAFPAAPTAARAAPAPRAAPLRAPAPPAIKIAAPVPLPVAPAPAPIASRAEEPTPAPCASTASTASAGMAASAPSAPIASAIMTAAAPAATTALGDRWYDLVKPLCDQGLLTALVRELATQSALRAVDAGADPPRWSLVVEREMLNTPALRDRLAAALATALGHPLALDVESGPATDTPSQRDAAERQRRQAAAEAAIRDDPLVRDLLAQFKSARIVPGSIKPVQP
ncbi:MAG: DNA polymerase III subunit gamma/tau, partial [Burkholderiales bacterium]|nr:DNA polymerase III subunit gamma/tau [Burkholderiales bacterium]